MKEKLRLALLISGGGTTATAIYNACKSGRLEVDPVLVIASSGDLEGIERIIKAGMASRDVVVVDPNKAEDMIKPCKERSVDWAGQYGWLPLTSEKFINALKGRVINQHPGPLDIPGSDFGGIYGRQVHAAVLFFRRMTKHDYWTEATAHLVTPKFDGGSVINREQIAIYPNDTVEDLRARVLPREHELQIRTLDDIVNGRMTALRREPPLIKENESDTLKLSLRVGRLLYPHG